MPRRPWREREGQDTFCSEGSSHYSSETKVEERWKEWREGEREEGGKEEGEEEEGMISRGKSKREGEKGRRREEGKKEKVEGIVVGWKGRKKGEKDESETFSHCLLPLLISLFCCSEPWVPAVC